MCCVVLQKKKKRRLSLETPILYTCVSVSMRFMLFTINHLGFITYKFIPLARILVYPPPPISTTEPLFFCAPTSLLGSIHPPLLTQLPRFFLVYFLSVSRPALDINDISLGGLSTFLSQTISTNPLHIGPTSVSSYGGWRTVNKPLQSSVSAAWIRLPYRKGPINATHN